jgi:hypothetical protein
MATIRKEMKLAASADAVWAAAADVGALHERLVPGFVVATQLEPGARLVTFAGGQVARELIVTVDAEARRLVWAVVGSELLRHHNAALQVVADGAGARVIWTADLLPDAAAATVAALMDQGLAAMRRAFEPR